MPSRQFGSPVTLQALFEPFAALSTKPFIPPSARQVANAVALCGPPPVRSWGSWNGATHGPPSGEGEQTVGTPPSIGIPSAPGNVPK